MKMKVIVKIMEAKVSALSIVCLVIPHLVPNRMSKIFIKFYSYSKLYSKFDAVNFVRSVTCQ